MPVLHSLFPERAEIQKGHQKRLERRQGTGTFFSDAEFDFGRNFRSLEIINQEVFVKTHHNISSLNRHMSIELIV